MDTGGSYGGGYRVGFREGSRGYRDGGGFRGGYGEVGVATQGVEVLEAVEGTGILGDVGGLTVEASNVWPLKSENVLGLEK